MLVQILTEKCLLDFLMSNELYWNTSTISSLNFDFDFGTHVYT